MHQVLTIIMAGGKGSRLLVLADRRAKPALPFGGIYRIVDFPLSNAMRSGARHLGIITQYRPYSLTDHVGLGEWWGFNRFGSKAKVLSPYTGEDDSTFYKGNADAVYQNIEFIERFPHVTEVLVLSGDHIYNMDYRPMLALHRDSGAQLTLATQAVPWEDTSRFGLVVADQAGRVTAFQEKPKFNPLSNQASLGIYIFDRQALIDALDADHDDPQSGHDFGGDIIPRLIERTTACQYEFKGYWRDVGTIRSYYDTSMEALDARSGLDLQAWGVRTNHREIPLGSQRPLRLAGGAHVRNSLVSKGSLVEGEVVDSILSPGVHVCPGARLKGCVILHDTLVGKGCVLENAIVDKNCVIEAGARVGDPDLGPEPNRLKPELLDQGTTVVGKGVRLGRGARIGRNCLIYPGTVLNGAGPSTIESGMTCFQQVDGSPRVV